MRQPIYCFETEMTIEEAKRRFGYGAPENAIGVRVGYSTCPPMEVDVCIRSRNA